MKLVDVAIIGAGPAGATAAFHLAKNGIRCAIIEKEELPRYKTCGGGLVWRGRNLLPFDVSDSIDAEFNKVDVYFYGQDIHVHSSRPFPIISMVMRDQFDFKLIKEAQQHGIDLHQKNKLIGLKREKNWIIETDQQTIETSFIIAADGALSPTAKLAGWKNETRNLIPALEYELEVGQADWERLSKEVRFDIDIIPSGYAWSFPKKNHLSIGVASAKRTKINLKEYYQKYIDFLGINEIKNEQGHGFQIPVSVRKDGFVKNNVLLTGDAAGFADPITAEGISNSIYSGLLAAEAIIEGNLNPDDVARIFNEKLNTKLIPELKTADFLANVFYNQVKLRNFLIKSNGQRFCDYMTNIFTGEKTYPSDLIKTVRKKLIGI